MIAPDMETAIDRLQELVDAARVIVPFTGAGISTECGIPDFRSPGGLWTKNKPIPFDEWCASPDGQRYFDYDTRGATESDLVIYLGPSGCDAWAEVGAAWARGVETIGLWAKGEQSGLMRRMVRWCDTYRDLLDLVVLQSKGVPLGAVVRK